MALGPWALGPGPGPFAKLLNEFVSQRSYFLLASLNYLMNLFLGEAIIYFRIICVLFSIVFRRLFRVFRRLFSEFRRFHEHEKEPQRPYDHFRGSSASVALLCVTKQRIPFLQKHLLLGVDDGDDDGDDGGDGRISSHLHPPIPSHPGMKYPVRANPSLRPST